MMTWDFFFRLLVAGILGAIIGLDREYRAKEAGFRTHFLVALGSALFMIVSKYGFWDILGDTGGPESYCGTGGERYRFFGSRYDYYTEVVCEGFDDSGRRMGDIGNRFGRRGRTVLVGDLCHVVDSFGVGRIGIYFPTSESAKRVTCFHDNQSGGD